MDSTVQITRLLERWAEGDPKALDELTPVVYRELRQIAAGYLRNERPDHTLQPTALVHEAYLRLIDQKTASWRNRTHFFGVAAHLMREILVDHARRRLAVKRSAHRMQLEPLVNMPKTPGVELLALDGALKALEKVDTRKSKAVELRYFGGLSLPEIADMLDISTITVRRDLRMAQAWLYHEMRLSG